MEQNKRIIIDNLHKSYGKKEVIKGISLEVYDGELFGFIGKNGVGKSTTIECMLGIKPFNSGDIFVNGFSIKKEPNKAKYDVGYVSSEPICYDDMTGFSFVEFMASVYKVEEEDYINNLNYLKNRLDLSDYDLNRQVKEYSHGMKQKLCLIASLIHNPSLWVLDEPTVGLDAFTANELSKMMKEYTESGKTCFITSHNIELVAKICDRVAIIKDGLIVATYDLASEPRYRYMLQDLFFEAYNGS